MFCCASSPSQITTSTIIKSIPQPCKRHGKNAIRFVCNTCIEQPLLCQDCISDHKSHDWISIESFFTQDVINLFQLGISKNGKIVQESVDKIVIYLVEYQQKMEKKIKQTIATIMLDLQKLKARFPVHGGYQLSSNQLNNKTMGQIIRIVNNQKYIFDTKSLQNTFTQILHASSGNIYQNLDKVKQTLTGHDWEILTQQEVLQIENNYLAIYKKKPANKKFFFSVDQRCKSIDLMNSRLTCVYNKQIPKRPAALLDKYLSQQNHKVGFKITKMQTHIHFFNMSSVYLGVCNPILAQGFSFLDLAKPSKGAYFISSDGYTYHSKLVQYHESSAAFSFTKGDIVTIQLNIENNTIIFQKKTGMMPFLKKVQMKLGLDQKYIHQLKPCVMFSNSSGAEVTILNQTQLQLEIDGKIVYPVLEVTD